MEYWFLFCVVDVINFGKILGRSHNFSVQESETTLLPIDDYLVTLTLFQRWIKRSEGTRSKKNLMDTPLYISEVLPAGLLSIFRKHANLRIYFVNRGNFPFIIDLIEIIDLICHE